MEVALQLLSSVLSSDLCILNLPLGSARIRTNDHAFVHRKVLAYPSDNIRFCEEIIDRDIEESLDLRCVEIHCDYMIRARCLYHICNQPGRDRGTGPILLILASFVVSAYCTS